MVGLFYYLLFPCHEITLYVALKNFWLEKCLGFVLVRIRLAVKMVALDSFMPEANDKLIKLVRLNSPSHHLEALGNKS